MGRKRPADREVGRLAHQLEDDPFVDLGQFLDIRDRWGMTQVVCNPADAPDN